MQVNSEQMFGIMEKSARSILAIIGIEETANSYNFSDDLCCKLFLPRERGKNMKKKYLRPRSTQGQYDVGGTETSRSEPEGGK